jgi:hypothetical protein
LEAELAESRNRAEALERSHKERLETMRAEMRAAIEAADRRAEETRRILQEEIDRKKPKWWQQALAVVGTVALSIAL